MDDHELIAALAAGDDTALRELFTRHAPWLAARLRAVLPPSDVEDVLQETFLAVWKGASAYQPRGTPQAWMWVIARNQAALLLRRRGPVTAPLGEVPQAGLDPAEAALARADIAAALNARRERYCASCTSRTAPSPRSPPCSASRRARSRAEPTAPVACYGSPWEEPDEYPERKRPTPIPQ